MHWLCCIEVRSGSTTCSASQTRDVRCNEWAADERKRRRSASSALRRCQRKRARAVDFDPYIYIYAYSAQVRLTPLSPGYRISNGYSRRPYAAREEATRRKRGAGARPRAAAQPKASEAEARAAARPTLKHGAQSTERTTLKAFHLVHQQGRDACCKKQQGNLPFSKTPVQVFFAALCQVLYWATLFCALCRSPFSAST